MIKSTTQTVRVIAGRWRRHLIRFPEIEGLRPTHDRIRETLFNWLLHEVDGAVCLDLFAGSGALGFEALSRGASKVYFVDNHPKVIQSIAENAKKLGTDNFKTILAELPMSFVKLPNIQFDIVFLDPPFKSGIIQPCIDWLATNGFVKQGGHVYIESEKEFVNLVLPGGWKVLKTSHTKSVTYRLLQVA